MPNSTPEAEIRTRIEARGKIPFKEFMEVALYHPTGGYYTSTKPFGATGDYYTSPTVHPAFGALLAVQLQRMWELLGKPKIFHAVELGAGNEILAHDILDYTASSLDSNFLDALEYIALERYSSNGARSFQHVKADAIPLRNIVGCFLSNELLDAFPVHRFRKEDGEILEVYVTINHDGELTETLDKPSEPEINEHLMDFEGKLPEGYQGEVNMDIGPWIQDVASALDRGFVVTIDYGYPRSELYRPDRPYGTFQTYYMHTEGSSPYQRIGMQDMTAHVDFTSLETEAKRAGLNPLGWISQSEYLRFLGLEQFVTRTRQADSNQRERQANLMALNELVKPDGLGRFKVSILERDTGISRIEDLIPSSPVSESMKLPLLEDRHMSLMEGRYPHQAELQVENLWPFDELDERD